MVRLCQFVVAGPWPPHSPDFTPCESFLLLFLEGHFHSDALTVSPVQNVTVNIGTGALRWAVDILDTYITASNLYVCSERQWVWNGVHSAS
jgi:aspartate/tyrosine/aromatic aminotransferase